MGAANEPSEAAVRVAQKTLTGGAANELDRVLRKIDTRAALIAAHDPANFKDPREVSVRWGAVAPTIEHAQRALEYELYGEAWQALQDLRRRFGSDR